jgi:hypothetical protein
MDRLKKIWPYILFLAMFLTIVFLYEYSNRQHMKYKEELEYQQAKSIKDSIKLRMMIRLKEDEAFEYRDSIRQQKIEYITLQNEKSQKHIRDVIRILPTSDTKFRDSLWTDEWTKQDTVSYR